MVAFSINHFRNGRFKFSNTKDNSKKDLTKFIDFDGSVDDDSYYLSEENRYHKMMSKEVNNKPSIYQLRKCLVRVKDPGVCPTLTANMGQGGHNVPFIHDANGLRKLTEYECLRLQSFPKEFTFPKNVFRLKRYMQIGNAVAVPIAELIAKEIKGKFKKEFK